jgi:hypothetical protein
MGKMLLRLNYIVQIFVSQVGVRFYLTLIIPMMLLKNGFMKRLILKI